MLLHINPDESLITKIANGDRIKAIYMVGGQLIEQRPDLLTTDSSTLEIIAFIARQNHPTDNIRRGEIVVTNTDMDPLLILRVK